MTEAEVPPGSVEQSRRFRRSAKARRLHPPAANLQQIVASSGHTPGASLADFTRLATAVQELQVADETSDSEGITRSTCLWVLMTLDRPLRSALEAAGVDYVALGDELTVHAVPAPSDASVAQLHQDFAQAVRDYLEVREQGPPVELADLAVAVLEAGARDPEGLLSRRLRRLSVDLDAAASAARALLPTIVVVPLVLQDFSETVRTTRTTLGSTTPVSAARIAEEIVAWHPDYGRGLAVTLRPSEGDMAPTDHWLKRVQRLYDMDAVRSTRHKVVDGQLLLLGLAELDMPLAEDLSDAGLLERLREDAQVLPRRESLDQPDWAPDAPATVDLLGRERLAEALAKRLRYLAGPDSPWTQSFIVHVDGPWGAGKSTLFEFLARELQRRTDADGPLSPTFLVVRVNAWREQRVGVQWWTLLSALRRAVSANARWYVRPFLWLAALLDRIRAGWVPFVAAMLVLTAMLAWLVGVTNFDLSASGKAADSVVKILALVSAAFGGLVAASRFLVPGSRKSAQAFIETSDNPMEELGRLFARTLRRACRPVVFLIDDLDRCDGAYLVKFLEVIQTLVRDAAAGFKGKDGEHTGLSARLRRRNAAAGPYAFVAADGQWIRASYEKHYEAFMPTGVPGRPLGYLFLEKVFQLQVRLPVLTDIAREAFLASLLAPRRAERSANSEQQHLAESAKAEAVTAKSETELIEVARKAQEITDARTRMDILGDVAVRFSERDVEARVEHALTRFGAYLEPNPRSMLLFVNTYSVLRQLRTLEEVLVPTDPLALWAVIDTRWPHLAGYLRLHPEAVLEEQLGTDTPEDIGALLRSNAVRAVLRDSKSGGLTPELVRQCSGSASQ